MLARKLTNKSDITFIDLSRIDLTHITDELLSNCKQQVYDKYVELGGNSAIAKSSAIYSLISSKSHIRVSCRYLVATLVCVCICTVKR
jgi:hypothetical protein